MVSRGEEEYRGQYLSTALSGKQKTALSETRQRLPCVGLCCMPMCAGLACKWTGFVKLASCVGVGGGGVLVEPWEGGGRGLTLLRFLS